MFSLTRKTPLAPVRTVEVDGAQELIERHYVVVYNLAYRTMGRREDAEDIAQQTFARALPRLADLRDPEAAAGWLCRIAANLCLDELRRRQLAQEDAEPDLDALPDSDPNVSPATVAERREVRAAVWSAALSLPHQQRLVLALREWQDLSYKQIAQALDISVPALESILFRARQGFRRAYQAGAKPWPVNETCKWMVERLSASIDEELRAGERARIDAHLPQCATCQFAARELRATKRLYGLMPLASVPAGPQLAALMVAPAVGVAPVVVAGLSGASGGGVLMSLGAAKVGFGTAAAMVGSAVMLLMGSDGISTFGTVDVALAAAAPVARTAVALPLATSQPVAQVAVVAARHANVADSAPSDPPRPVPELAKVEPLRIAPDATPTPLPTVVLDAADRRGVSPVAEAQSLAPITPIGRESSGSSEKIAEPASSRSSDARTAAAPAGVISTLPPADAGPLAQSPASEDPIGDEDATAVPSGPDEEKPGKSPHADNSDRPGGGNPHSGMDGGEHPTPGNNANANANANANGVNPPGSAVGQNASTRSAPPDPPGQAVRQDPPGPAASTAPPGVRASSPSGQGAPTPGAGPPIAPPSGPPAAAAPQVPPGNAAPGGKPQLASAVSPPNSKPEPPAKPESAAKPPSPPAGASPAQVGGGAKLPGPPGK
jgi:RNA polymerase sigma factor (sigma-70 family)